MGIARAYERGEWRAFAERDRSSGLTVEDELDDSNLEGHWPDCARWIECYELDPA